MFQKKGRWLFRLWVLKTTWVIGWSSGAQRELDRWETSTSNFEKLDIWQGSCLAQDFLQTVRFTQRITQGIVSASETLCSVQFSRSVVSDSLRPHKSQHAIHHQLLEFTQTHIHQVGDAIQPSHPLSSPFPPAPNNSQHQSFPMSQLFAWGGQSTGVSALASVLPKKSQSWSPSKWTGWISLQSKALKSLLQHHSSKASILRRSAFFTVQLSHPYMTTGKTIALTRRGLGLHNPETVNDRGTPMNGCKVIA